MSISNLRLLFITTTVTALLCAGKVFAEPNQSIKISYTDYAPYFGAELPNQGPIMQIIKEAFAHEGISVKAEQMPWARAYEWAKRGSYDALCCAWVRKERLKHFHYSPALPKTKVSLFKLRTSPFQYQKPEDLVGKRIGIVRGFAKPVALKNSQIHYHPSHNDLQNFKKLLAGRIDFVVTDNATAMVTLQNINSDQQRIEKLSPPVQEESQHLVFSKRNPRSLILMKHFGKGLKALKQSGRYTDILAQYKFMDE